MDSLVEWQCDEGAGVAIPQTEVEVVIGPLLLVYQLHLGLNNAIIYLVQHAHSHLDNTIQPQLLEEMLRIMGVDLPPQHLDH